MLAWISCISCRQSSVALWRAFAKKSGRSTDVMPAIENGAPPHPARLVRLRGEFVGDTATSPPAGPWFNEADRAAALRRGRRAVAQVLEWPPTPPPRARRAGIPGGIGSLIAGVLVGHSVPLFGLSSLAGVYAVREDFRDLRLTKRGRDTHRGRSGRARHAAMAGPNGASPPGTLDCRPRGCHKSMLRSAPSH
jgi:hypothetical protein